MAKQSPETVVSAQPEQEQALTLDEFCTRLSMTDRRVELIGAWHFTEKRAGVVKDTESAFKARFIDFATHPA